MIICAPDITPDVAAKFGVEPCVLVTLGRAGWLRRGMKVLVDVGLTGARRGVDVATYIAYIRRVGPTWAVCPDVFGDFRGTLSQWFRFSQIIERYTAPIFVAQMFYRYLDATVDLLHLGLIGRVALPLRAHPDVSCGAQPKLCAGRAERVLRALCGYATHVHLLGPALRVLRTLKVALKDCERSGTLVSLDTSSYRRAANSELKRRLGGRWMPRDSSEAVLMLETWLRQAFL